MLYGHIFHRGNPSGPKDLGRVAAESFWRAFGVGEGNIGKVHR